MKASKALTVSVSVFRGQISWRFSLSKNNISPAAPDLELILFPLWYWPVMNAHTKQQQDKVFETDLLTVNPPRCVPFGTKSYTYYIWHKHVMQSTGRNLQCLKTYRPILRPSNTNNYVIIILYRFITIIFPCCTLHCLLQNTVMTQVKHS